MNKMNKKGFTLIEMLVVIAIIAVLVSIVIPVVGNSTKRAEAATDAANLRSMQATLTIMGMNGELAETSTAKKVSTVVSTAPASKSGDGDMMYTYDEDTGVVVNFGEGKDITYYSGIAGGDSSDATTEAK